MNITCPYCNTILEVDGVEPGTTVQCPACSKSFVAKENVAPKVKIAVEQGTNPDAGTYKDPDARRDSNGAVNKDKDEWLITLLLCFFFGGLGVYKFYTKDTTNGIIMLSCYILGWILSVVYIGVIPLLIVSIWWFIDFIKLLCGTYRTSDGRLISNK